VNVAKTTDKPIFLSWSARDEVAPEAYAKLAELELPHYKSPVRCGRALAAVSAWAEARRLREARLAEKPMVIERPAVRQSLAGRKEDVAEYAAKQVLAGYGIPVTQERLAATKDEALAAARAIGYPVAMKVQSPDISHKTEAKAVKLGVADDAALAAAYDEILATRRNTTPRHASRACWCRRWSPAASRRSSRDQRPALRPAVMFGLGGIFAEVLKDVAFRLAPVTKSAALDMIARSAATPCSPARARAAGRRRGARRRDRAALGARGWTCRTRSPSST